MESKRRIPPQLRRMVWETWMKDPKSTVGPCFVCGTQIHILNFECGHVESFADGGLTTVENLRPICSPCNKSMGKKDLNTYKDQWYKGTKEIKDKEIKKAKNQKEENFGTKLYSIMTSFMDLTISKPKTCTHVMVKGKRKGEPCGEKLVENTRYCRKHQGDLKKK